MDNPEVKKFELDLGITPQEYKRLRRKSSDILLILCINKLTDKLSEEGIVEKEKAGDISYIINDYLETFN